ncbi:hypothetical protein SRB5_10600 [Streptomyces sp. RB5]|uniref:Lipoprotein n=1 Tax=Streptomyces smaragdinus TaxID=2585196 RepID=A0A7K0CC08_9ACTN|nr:hypothetical protein [Streptomyces smaragdinus]MQY10946.1 hypothetical protein [Streptomyces smaragdinus]
MIPSGIPTGRLLLPALALATALTATACDPLADAGRAPARDDRPAVRTTPEPSPTAPRPVTLADLAGLGPLTTAHIPAAARQAVVVTGQGRNSSRSHVVLYRKTASGWQAGATWPAHNAVRGWTADHRLGDLRSPIGVFTLSDAGGRLPDPGTKLPYTHSGGFVTYGTGFEGESLAGSFDYVVAIDYNHVKGTSPLDWGRPQGADKGGGIWLHVDHGGPTQACVSLAETHMKELLRTLDPALHPVVVMGDADSLAR